MYVEMLGITKQGTAAQSVMYQHCDHPHTLKISRTINLLYAFHLAICLSVGSFVIEAQIHTNPYTLQRFQMTVMSSRINGQQTVCSTLSSNKQHRNIKGPYGRHFEGNPPLTGGFLQQGDSNAEYVFIWWRYNVVSHPIFPRGLMA